MAKLQFLIAGLATSALASPWSLKREAGNGWSSYWASSSSSASSTPAGPAGYGSTSSSTAGGWGHSLSATCKAATITHTAVSTYTESGGVSIVTLSGERSTVTLPGSTYTESQATSTVYVNGSAYTEVLTTTIEGAPVTACATTVPAYVTRTLAGYNSTPLETSTITVPGSWFAVNSNANILCEGAVTTQYTTVQETSVETVYSTLPGATVTSTSVEQETSTVVESTTLPGATVVSTQIITAPGWFSRIFSDTNPIDVDIGTTETEYSTLTSAYTTTTTASFGTSIPYRSVD
ncbi:hypothetical protein LTS00_007206 [Friedmanniomyces endolithicus]|uniref:Uncharacterized protein n=1 Tax=Friedmanniomyces endolithicus TaxID=329885 RepID=A0AAN6FXX9_9PEZI|nr:hypothetical protein LTS00_007206 [Friedmanniomyces endolithicus]KAK0325451.1 hypothetical protein LTR82_003734 [Friedmanniomyces endolithicus]